MTEKQVQSDVIKLLKLLGWYVIKTQPGMGTPTGMLDMVAFKGRTYIVLEFKKSSTAPFQPLQKETLTKFKSWGVYSKVVYPENLEEVKADIRRMS